MRIVEAVVGNGDSVPEKNLTKRDDTVTNANDESEAVRVQRLMSEILQKQSGT